MGNSTQFTTIILAGYIDVGCVKYFYFTVLLLMYIAVILANSLLIGVICVERSLHEPMYIFICSLSVNELYGSAAFFLSILTNMLSKSHEITVIHCYIQIFSLYTYASVEFGNLAIMSYDRYTAICYPLIYSSIMTRKKVFILIALVWLISFVKFSVNLLLNLRSELCGNVIDKVWCDNYMLVKLACSDTTVNNIYGIIGAVLTIVLPLILISYSYLKILIVCLKSSAGATQKIMATCTPHLISLLNFSLGCSFEIFSSRFDKLHMPSMLRVIISVYFVICPPLLNPIMYGIKLSNIKMACKKKIISLM